jgi:hypothetical protein
MTDYLSGSRYFPKKPAWSVLGTVAPTTNRIVDIVYPMKTLTDFHQSHHIAGITGRWNHRTLDRHVTR